MHGAVCRYPPICLSLTFLHSGRTAKDIIDILSLSATSIMLIFSQLNHIM